MSFTTPLYALFLFLVVFLFLVFHSFPFRNQGKTFRVFFLVVSYLFYASWNYFSLILIITTSITDFFVSNLIQNEKRTLRKRLLLISSLLINLGILFFFKYYSFFVKNLSYSLNIFGFSASWIPVLNLTLPVGISFYTFQSLSYTLDVYRGEIIAEKNFWKYLLYVSFFPQLVAGPIVPAKFLLPQLENFFLNEENWKKGLGLLSLGLIKKVIVADRLAPLVDTFYSNPSAYSSAASIMAVLSYSVQIFCDFSGYTDIARGSAFLFGIKLPENFNAPYLSLSFTEFWRRWHITLSNWLKNYLYISLGGNRKGEFRTYVNLLLTMLLGGLWHGASWNFVLWGLGHGTLLVLEKFFFKGYFSHSSMSTVGPPVDTTGEKPKKIRFLGLFFKWLFVFICVTLLWVPFRSSDFEITILVLKKIFIYNSGLNFPNSWQNEFFLLFFLVFISHFFYSQSFDIEIYTQKIPSYVLIFFFAILLHLVILLAKDSKPFIYFVF